MRNFRLLVGSALMAVTMLAGLSSVATAQVIDGIDFGDDTSRWANDGECDDPRFTGEGSAAELVADDEMHDATDCAAAYRAGTIMLSDDAPPASTPTTGTNTPSTTPTETDAAEIDFGDDTSRWANDGECDDPRFTGAGMAAELVEDDRMRDATDCQTLFEAGDIRLAGDASDTPATTAGAPDFGDDTSPWANDGECDDPRFTGTGMAAEVVEADTLRDATDCRTLFEAGDIRLIDAGGDAGMDSAEIDFGDDTSQWANDDECDDPRFVGEGMAAAPVAADEMRDATDCQTLFNAGSITLRAEVSADDIDFGDDSGTWPNDGECDDPRFTGPGVFTGANDENIMRDATDCLDAFTAGTAVLVSDAGPAQFDYGTDTSRWANDGECDDPRFFGAGTNKKLLPEDERADATDCRTLVEAGTVEILAVYVPGYASDAPFDTAGIEFGNNTSSYANDDECDDPRFVGPGMAYAAFETDEFRDANDCRTAFENGTIMLKP
jgi:hypothetical protein